eukprot:TRINITY_DN2205_c0_g2_i2.p1 TRINITY_DN2205_c0_g2~~TRINITY_DN2205_c0_g2_i2.p1  ORF type:complete len:331 (-),score=68.78 TRINITY_DN2205_c0_g2_i2:604-1596(-)
MGEFAMKLAREKTNFSATFCQPRQKTKDVKGKTQRTQQRSVLERFSPMFGGVLLPAPGPAPRLPRSVSREKLQKRPDEVQESRALRNLSNVCNTRPPNVARRNLSGSRAVVPRSAGIPKTKKTDASYQVIERRIDQLRTRLVAFRKDLCAPKKQCQSFDASTALLDDGERTEKPPPEPTLDEGKELRTNNSCPDLMKYVTQVNAKHPQPSNTEVIAEKKSSFLEFVTDRPSFFQKYNRSTGGETVWTEFKETLGLLHEAFLFSRGAVAANPMDFFQKQVFLGPKKGKKTLIFDLDETLIHCLHNTEAPCDAIVDITLPGGEIAKVSTLTL